MTTLTVKEVAKKLKRGDRAIRMAAAEGRFGDTVHRGAKGEWLFDCPRALTVFAQKTDYTKAPQLENVPPREAGSGASYVPTPFDLALERETLRWLSELEVRLTSLLLSGKPAAAADLEDLAEVFTVLKSESEESIAAHELRLSTTPKGTAR